MEKNMRILTSSESKKFKFYILDFIYEKIFGETWEYLLAISKKFKFYILDVVYEKKFWGYFLKKTPFSIFKGLLGLDWEIFLGGPNTSQSACLKPWSKKSYLWEFVF